MFEPVTQNVYFPTEVSWFMPNTPEERYVSYIIRCTFVLQHTAEENPGHALNVCLLRCTHLSCMTSHMKIHIWKACVCVCMCVDNMSGPFCRHQKSMTLMTSHAVRVLFCLQEGGKETERAGRRWWRVQTLAGINKTLIVTLERNVKRNWCEMTHVHPN